MDIEDDPDYDIFRDDEDDPDAQLSRENDFTKEYVVYLVDASHKMFNTTCPSSPVCFSSSSSLSHALVTQFVC
jgi:ATP-dependent DNA helicase 2 subunit 1